MRNYPVFVALIVQAAVIIACAGSSATTPALLTPLSTVPTVTTNSQGSSASLELLANSGRFGDAITVVGTRLDETQPIEVYLLTEAQANALDGILHADLSGLVKLGQLSTIGGRVAFQFVLRDSYKTAGGSTLHLAVGDVLEVYGMQRSAGAAHFFGIGPLTVK